MNTKSFILDDKLQRLVNLAKNQKVPNLSDSRMVLGCTDLTSLTGQETEMLIEMLCAKAAILHTGSVCVFPEFVKSSYNYLQGTGVNTATVINFPDGHHRTRINEIATPESVEIDVKRAIEMRAGQVDIVLDYEHMAGGHAKKLLKAARKACPEDVTLMVIVESASYKTAEDLSAACSLAISAGVDFLKTSTGKHSSGGATPEAVAVMLQAIKDSKRDVGIKITGGVKDLSDCLPYMYMFRHFFGWDSIRFDRFRIGASGMVDNIIRNKLNLVPANSITPNDPAMQAYS
ncbi:MAG: deoxyribose-phosphate aldolase [Alphaproteobacteria bacterium CG1_02_46_17]|nr:MAG: deoxyribose-phosphate aldolase [Alphaproteobacteria bacterium CG1_02_46_17]